MSKRLNLEEIGRLAGVSRSTVSRVVNGAPNVSDEAKAKVEAVVEQTGYRPDAAARSLATSRTGVEEVGHGSHEGPGLTSVPELHEPSAELLRVTRRGDHQHQQQTVSPSGTVVCESCGARSEAIT